MWLVVCSSVNCLLSVDDPLINGKFENESSKTTVTQSSNDNSTNSTVDTLDPKNVGYSHSALEPHKRVKRVHIFRPLFVYRQENIERQRIIENRKFQNRQTNTIKGIEREKNKQCCTCNCDCHRRY